MATKHQRETHPEYQSGCLACKFSSVQFAPSVAASTAAGAHVVAAKAWDTQNEKDITAYKQLVASGLQPARVGGADHWVKSGATDYEIVSGQNFDRQYGDDMAKTMRKALPDAIQAFPDVMTAVAAQPPPLDNA